jgi:hypothetical protein
MNEPMTAAQSILLAAAELARAGKQTFTEWDLSVQAWQQDNNRFGCRGYEEAYPDHKRVMMEIMGQTKKDNPLRRGWFEKTGRNLYRITSLGLAEAERVSQLVGKGLAKAKSPTLVYESVEPFVFSRTFLDFSRDTEEPRTWLGASAFLSLSANTPNALDDSLRRVRAAATGAINWLDQEKLEVLRRGPVGGGKTIRRGDLERLLNFVLVLERRFALQMNSIRKSKSG